jgi:hypothetical protein
MYRSEIGNLGDMISTITKIEPVDENPLKLDDHGFVRYHGTPIRKLKNLVNGKLQPNATADIWRETAEFHLQPGEIENYYGRKSNEARRLSGIQQRYSDGISDWARKWGLPSDLCHKSGYKKDDETSEEENDSCKDGKKKDDATSEEESDDKDATSEEESDDNKKGNEEDSNTTMSSRRNYYKVFDQKSKVRKHMEETASNGQKKQAVAVNKNRLWLGGETLPKGTVCLLRISEGKNNIGVKDLPVVIIGVHYYRQSGNIRYKVASKDGFISGTFSRGELRPQEHVTAKLMGINVSQLEGGPKTALTPLQAHSMYLPIGGKNTKCRCKMDCSKSPSCSCRKAGKFCTKHCHKGNIVCQWCEQQP